MLTAIRRSITRGLPSIAASASCKNFRAFGGLFGFELQSDVDLWEFLNRLKVIVKSNNLGDNRTLAIPVAHTIYFEMGPGDALAWELMNR